MRIHNSGRSPAPKLQHAKNQSYRRNHLRSIERGRYLSAPWAERQLQRAITTFYILPFDLYVITGAFRLPSRLHSRAWLSQSFLLNTLTLNHISWSNQYTTHNNILVKNSMDHLALPNNPFYPAIHIPYLAGGRWTYDGLGLADFPERKGSSTQSLRHGPSLQDTVNDMLALLQSWLFVGLLQETFKACCIRVGPEDFVNLTECGQQVLNTAVLPQLIYVWETSERDAPKSAKSRRLAEIDKCMSVAVAALHDLSNATWLQEAGLPAEILLSITTLGEAILHARGEIYTDRMLRVPTALGGEVFTRLPQLGCVDQLLLGAGWCPFEVRVLRDQANNSSRYYFSMLDRTAEAPQHQHCTVSKCVLNHKTEESYRSFHVAESCHCSHLVSEDEEHPRVSAVLKSGHTPLIVVPSTSPIQEASGHAEPLQVISSHCSGPTPVVNHALEKVSRQNYASWAVKNSRSRPTIPYVAVSHVWRGGLGNPNANSLPWCQLRRIQDLVNGLYKARGPIDIPFWMDTLCVPLKPEDRRVAIQGMKGVYQEAEKVIVLDTFLESCQLSTNTVENLMKIRCSSWMQRLWTFQEGILARSLHFQFAAVSMRGEELLDGLIRSRRAFLKNTKVEVDHLLKTRVQVSNSVVKRLISMVDSFSGVLVNLDLVLTHDVIASDARRCFKRIRFPHSFDSHTLLKKQHEAEVLSKLSQSLRWRITTRDEDEALVLTNLLGLSTKDLLDARAEITMGRVFKSMSAVPVDVLFTPREHLHGPGCSWIPKSLLYGQGHTGLNSREGVVTRQGLKVELPGIILGTLKRNNFAVNNGATVSLIIQSDENAYSMRVMYAQDADDVQRVGNLALESENANSTEVFAVILERLLPKFTPVKGALIKVTNKGSKKLIGRWFGVVKLQRDSFAYQQVLHCNSVLDEYQEWLLQ